MGRTGASLAAPMFMIAGWGNLWHRCGADRLGRAFYPALGSRSRTGAVDFCAHRRGFRRLFMQPRLQPGAEWSATHMVSALAVCLAIQLWRFLLTALPIWIDLYGQADVLAYGRWLSCRFWRFRSGLYPGRTDTDFAFSAGRAWFWSMLG